MSSLVRQRASRHNIPHLPPSVVSKETSFCTDLLSRADTDPLSSSALLPLNAASAPSSPNPVLTHLCLANPTLLTTALSLVALDQLDQDKFIFPAV